MLVTALQTSAAVESKLAEHGVLVREVRQVFSNPRLVRHNRRAPGRVEVFGRTNGGRALVVALDPTIDDTVWEIVTAYNTPEHQLSLVP